jgi:hypothetical protein
VGGEVVGERGEFGGVASEPLHLVDGEDDPAVRGVGLDLAGGSECGLELGADSDPVLVLSAGLALGRDCGETLAAVERLAACALTWPLRFRNSFFSVNRCTAVPKAVVVGGA